MPCKVIPGVQDRGRNTGRFCFMNYRKLYEKHYGIKIPPEYDIHHIDGNRGNNAIDNLVLLPKHTHATLHLICNVFGCGIDGKMLMKIAMNPHQINWYGTYFKLFADILPDLIRWITTKDWEDMAIAQGKINNTDNSYNCFRK